MKKLSIIQTADIHGRIHDFPYVAAYIDRLRKSGEPVMAVDSGDVFRGHILSEHSEGKAAAKIMSTIGYDCMVYGNDEHFKNTDEMEAMQSRLNFPVLAAMTRKADGSRVFPAFTVVERGGFKIGVIGLEAKMPPMPGGAKLHLPGMQNDTELTDPYEEAAAAEKQLRQMGCDFVMVVCHLGVDDTYQYPSTEVARRVTGIDLIADGHSHHPLPEGIWVGDTLITQPADRLASFVHITLTADDEGKISKSCRLISMADCKAELAPDPEIQAIIDEQQALVNAGAVVLGHTPCLLDGGRPQIRARETNLGDIVCDAFAFAGGAVIGFCGGGNIRASIEPGDITAYDVKSVFANSSRISLGRCTGRWIINKMEKGLADCPVQSPGFTQVSGLKVVYDESAQPGSRIVSICLESGEPIDEDKLYLAAGTLTGGPFDRGDEPGCEIIRELGSDRDALELYLKSGKAEFYAEPKGRIVHLTVNS